MLRAPRFLFVLTCLIVVVTGAPTVASASPAGRGAVPLRAHLAKPKRRQAARLVSQFTSPPGATCTLGSVQKPRFEAPRQVQNGLTRGVEQKVAFQVKVDPSQVAAWQSYANNTPYPPAGNAMYAYAVYRSTEAQGSFYDDVQVRSDHLVITNPVDHTALSPVGDPGPPPRTGAQTITRHSESGSRSRAECRCKTRS